MKKLLVALAIVLLIASTSFAAVQATFTWDASEGADFYTLHMIDPVGADTVIADNISTVETSVSQDATTPGVYQFYVTASNGGGTSLPSNVVSQYFGVPGAPANFTITVTFQ